MWSAELREFYELFRLDISEEKGYNQIVRYRTIRGSAT